MVTAFQGGSAGRLPDRAISTCNAVVYGHSVSGFARSVSRYRGQGLQRCGVWSQRFRAQGTGWSRITLISPATLAGVWSQRFRAGRLHIGTLEPVLKRCGVWSQRFRGRGPKANIPDGLCAIPRAVVRSQASALAHASPQQTEYAAPQGVAARERHSCEFFYSSSTSRLMLERKSSSFTIGTSASLANPTSRSGAGSPSPNRRHANDEMVVGMIDHIIGFSRFHYFTLCWS